MIKAEIYFCQSFSTSDELSLDEFATVSDDDEQPQVLSLDFARTLSSNCRNSQFLDINDAYLSSNDSETFLEEILDRLEAENGDLIQRLNETQNEDEEDDEWLTNVMDVFDNDDLNEMEQLFKKCDAAIHENKMRKLRSNRIKSRWSKHVLCSYNAFK